MSIEDDFTLNNKMTLEERLQNRRIEMILKKMMIGEYSDE